MHPIKQAVLFLLLFVCLLVGCQKRGNNGANLTSGESRSLDSFIGGVMYNYTAYYSKKKTDPDYIVRVPGAVRPDYYFTVGATYKGDSIKILLPRLLELIKLSEEIGAPTDSLSLVALVKGIELLKLNDEAMDIVTVVRKWKSIDSVTAAGKQQALYYYFIDNGMMRGDLHLSNQEESYLIDRLSDWGVLVLQDDESGYFQLEKNYPNDAVKFEK